MKKLIIVGVLLIGLFQISFANNIQITGKPSLVYKNTTAKTVYINFPLTWDNSWKSNTPENWDAAWVFVKYREGGTDWNHVYIDTQSSAHRAKANVDVDMRVGTSNVTFIEDGSNVVKNKGVGIFLYRAENGKGTIKFDSILLRWKYADQDLDDEAVVSIRVFAIEAVYVPQAPYELGDRTGNNRAISFLGNSGDIVLGTAGFNPPGTRNTVFRDMGTITYPTGAINTVGNGSNGAPKGWYAEQSPTGATLYRNAAYHAWSAAIVPFQNNTPSGSTTYIYHAERMLGANYHTLLLKMPQPYKASGAYFAWYASYPISRYRIEGSIDSVNWVTLAGDLTTNYTSAQIPANKNYYCPIPLDKQAAYQYYKYDLYTNSYMTLSAIGMYDSTVNGYPENAYYYDYGRSYKGKMPLRWNGTGQVSNLTYPNGYEAFYIMKYELSQHAYVDFLNTLSEPQQRSRAGVNPTTGVENAYHATNTTTPSTTHRNYVMLKTKNVGQPAYYYCYQSNSRDITNYDEQGGNIAMSFLSWADNAAYLCWAGLRPLTELEYEKTCKGPAKANNPPIPGMFAWGTTNAVVHTGIASADMYTKREMVLPANANFISQIPNNTFPARVGCLATQTSTRADAGAAYYGAMNMSDNVSEFYVNCETLAGLAFDGEHGSGMLDGDGNAQVKTWPDNTTASAAHGTGFKGVMVNTAATSTGAVADRTNIAATASYIVNRYGWAGCRGGRTAPSK